MFFFAGVECQHVRIDDKPIKLFWLISDKQNKFETRVVYECTTGGLSFSCFSFEKLLSGNFVGKTIAVALLALWRRLRYNVAPGDTRTADRRQPDKTTCVQFLIGLRDGKHLSYLSSKKLWTRSTTTI